MNQKETSIAMFTVLKDFEIDGMDHQSLIRVQVILHSLVFKVFIIRNCHG